MGDNQNNTKGVNINSSESMGQYGNYIVNATSKVFDSKLSFCVLDVKDGTCTINTGKQEVLDKYGDRELPDWDGLVLEQGVHIVNLKELSVTTTGVTVCWYGAM